MDHRLGVAAESKECHREVGVNLGNARREGKRALKNRDRLVESLLKR